LDSKAFFFVPHPHPFFKKNHDLFFFIIEKPYLCHIKTKKS